MKILVGILLSMIGCISCVASGRHSVDISRLGATYERGQPVGVALKNIGPTGVRVYSNVEVLDEKNKWVTWPFRLEDGRADVVSIIYPLPVGRSIKLTFDVRKIALPPIPLGHKPKLAKKLKLRFRVVALGMKSDAQLEELFSEPFVVMDPYDEKPKVGS